MYCMHEMEQKRFILHHYWSLRTFVKCPSNKELKSLRFNFSFFFIEWNLIIRMIYRETEWKKVGVRD